VADDPPRWHGGDVPQHPPLGVEEIHIEREAHAEGVDRAAVRDQEAAVRGQLVKPGEAEQPRPCRARDEHPRAAGQRQLIEPMQALRDHSLLRGGWRRARLPEIAGGRQAGAGPRTPSTLGTPLEDDVPMETLERPER
jgi:hypothetical protein